MVESQRNTIDHGGLVLFALGVAESRDRRSPEFARSTVSSAASDGLRRLIARVAAPDGTLDGAAGDEAAAHAVANLERLARALRLAVG